MKRLKNKTFSKILNGRKTKSYTILFRVITAYSHDDYEKFSFESWICLIINKKPVFFKRFGWENIFKKNWKYIGPSKENYIYSWPIDTWYIINYDFINKIITVKEK